MQIIRLTPARSVNLAAPPQRPHRDRRDNCRIASYPPRTSTGACSVRKYGSYGARGTSVPVPEYILRSTSRLYRTRYRSQLTFRNCTPSVHVLYAQYDEFIKYAALTIQAHTNGQPNCRRYAVSDRSILLEVETDLTGAHSPRQRL